MIKEYTIPEKLNGLRLDKALVYLVNKYSRTQIQRIINNSQVKVNSLFISDSNFEIKENDIIYVDFKTPSFLTMQEANITLDIFYEDNDLIVINKVAGMTVHPGSGNHQDTLVNALLYHTKFLSDIGGLERPGVVHRLDKDTSGLMVVAKNNLAHVHLAKQIESRNLTRKYKALIWGIMNPASGIIRNNIGRNRIKRQKMSILKYGGKEAITSYKTEEVFLNGLISMIECKLTTGRTHQIRVQLSHLQHSVLGDQTYGHNNRKMNQSFDAVKQKLINLKRQALHSWYISFTHPVSGKFLEFQSTLPKDIIEIIS